MGVTSAWKGSRAATFARDLGKTQGGRLALEPPQNQDPLTPKRASRSSAATQRQCFGEVLSRQDLLELKQTYNTGRPVDLLYRPQACAVSRCGVASQVHKGPRRVAQSSASVGFRSKKVCLEWVVGHNGLCLLT